MLPQPLAPLPLPLAAEPQPLPLALSTPRLLWLSLAAAARHNFVHSRQHNKLEAFTLRRQAAAGRARAV